MRVLIDTWWNVNVYDVRNGSYRYTVLIDTWWNVNVQGATALATATAVLIDTWWNVNCARCWEESSE